MAYPHDTLTCIVAVACYLVTASWFVRPATLRRPKAALHQGNNWQHVAVNMLPSTCCQVLPPKSAYTKATIGNNWQQLATIDNLLPATCCLQYVAKCCHCIVRPCDKNCLLPSVARRSTASGKISNSIRATSNFCFC
jgi:hypothetical protein